MPPQPLKENPVQWAVLRPVLEVHGLRGVAQIAPWACCEACAGLWTPCASRSFLPRPFGGSGDAARYGAVGDDAIGHEPVGHESGSNQASSGNEGTRLCIGYDVANHGVGPVPARRRQGGTGHRSAQSDAKSVLGLPPESKPPSSAAGGKTATGKQKSLTLTDFLQRIDFSGTGVIFRTGELRARVRSWYRPSGRSGLRLSRTQAHASGRYFSVQAFPAQEQVA